MSPFVVGRFQFALPIFATMLFAGVCSAAPAEPLTLKGHTGWVGGVAFSPDGKTIATASADHTAKFWDAATGKELTTLKAHDDIVSAVAYSKDGTHFATAGFDGTAKVWTAAKRELVHTFKGGRGALLAVAFNPNGKALATAGIDGNVRVWELDGKAKAAPASAKPADWPMKKQNANADTAAPRRSGAIWVALVCRVLCNM